MGGGGGAWAPRGGFGIGVGTKYSGHPLENMKNLAHLIEKKSTYFLMDIFRGNQMGHTQQFYMILFRLGRRHLRYVKTPDYCNTIKQF